MTAALLRKSPEYVPRKMRVPRANVEVVHFAMPPESGTDAQAAITVNESLNATVPVGDDPPATFTVSVTAWPNVAEEVDETIVAASAADPLTFSVMGPATPAPYRESPEYTPVMACEPAASALVVQVAFPAERAIAEQAEIEVPLSLKAIVPVGAFPLPMTFTTKETLCPALTVYDDEAMVAETGAVPVGG